MSVTRSPDETTLRQATADDAGELVRLVNAAFAVERFFIDGERIDVAQVTRYMAQGVFLLAELDGAALGCVYIELRGDRGYLGLLSVDPGRQRTGLGRRMVAGAEEFVRAAGCTAMDIQVVNLRTELPPIYRRLGYVETGTAPFAPGIATKQPCHFVIMSKSLAQTGT
jgi:GNAT superfamily N-acetyltransferase